MATRSNPAQNAVVTEVVDYGMDPNGHWLFHGLSTVLARGMQGRERPAVLPLWDTYQGWCASPQGFRGQAALGRAAAMVPTSSELAKESSYGTTDPIMRLFQARMARGLG